MAKIKGIKTKVGDATSAVAKVTADASGGTPVSSGIVTMLAQGTVPSGWLLCDGAEYVQSTYSGLYSVIGSAYNTHPTLGAASAGKFRVPDFRDMFPLGMNPSGDTGTTSLGTYSTTGWNHTHTVPAHTHTLGNHTHTLGGHTHSVAGHSHTLGAHTHGIPSHTHGVAQHIHYFAAHCHSHAITVTASHYHQESLTNTTTTGTALTRCGQSSSTFNLGTGSGSSGYTINIGGTVGADYLADNGFNTNWYSVSDVEPTGPATGSTGTPSANSGTSAAFNSGTPSAASGAPSSNTTSSDGESATGGANPPYFGVHFIIKA